MVLILSFELLAPAFYSSSAAASPCCSLSGVAECDESPPDAAACQVLRAPSSSLSQPVSVCPACCLPQASRCYFSDSDAPSLSLPSFSSSSVTPLMFFSSVTPHRRSICSLCLCSDQCWEVHVLVNTVYCNVSAVHTVLSVYSSQKNTCHIIPALRGRACRKLLWKSLKSKSETPASAHLFPIIIHAVILTGRN